MRVLVAACTALLLAGCASTPEPGDSGTAGVWGYVRLVPRAGVAEATGGKHMYADRSLEGVQLVDYSSPGFVVVYVDGEPAAGERSEIAIAPSAAGVRLDPPHAAIALGGALVVRNSSTESHAISCPAAKLVRRLAPGESAEIALSSAGEWNVFLLDVPGEQARVFAAPGPYQVVSPAGRFELEELAPKTIRLHAWHPRFPAASASVELVADDVVRQDLELSVDRLEGEEPDAD